MQEKGRHPDQGDALVLSGTRRKRSNHLDDQSLAAGMRVLAQRGKRRGMAFAADGCFQARHGALGRTHSSRNFLLGQTCLLAGLQQFVECGVLFF